MLYKCANPPCVSLFRSMHQGKLFMVESGPQENESHYSAPTTGQRRNRTPRMEHYWLCDKCFPVVTLTFSKGIGLIMVPLLPPHTEPATLKKSAKSLRLSEMLSQPSNDQPEIA
jgi:hypothetical protein